MLGLSVSLLGCDGQMSTTRVERRPGTATVTNPPPPPQGSQLAKIFETTFVGWQFGGAFNCDPNGRAVMVQIWDGVFDPCREAPPEGARVVVIEVSDTSAGSFEFDQVCSGPHSAGAVFGIVQGGTLFLQQAIEGSVSMLGINDDDVLEGAFSVRFPDAFGFTQGGFTAEPHCLQNTPTVGGVGNGTTGGVGTPGGGRSTDGAGTDTGVGPTGGAGTTDDTLPPPLP